MLRRSAPAQLGMKGRGGVEKRDSLGGTCLNIGCIPPRRCCKLPRKVRGGGARRSRRMAVQGSRALDSISGPCSARKDKVVGENTRRASSISSKGTRSPGSRALVGSRPPITVEVGGESIKDEVHRHCHGSDVRVSSPVSRSTRSASSPPTGRTRARRRVPKRFVVIGGGYIGPRDGLGLRPAWARRSTVVEFPRPHHAGHGC